jgi:hypothetical protein
VCESIVLIEVVAIGASVWDVAAQRLAVISKICNNCEVLAQGLAVARKCVGECVALMPIESTEQQTYTHVTRYVV